MKRKFNYYLLILPLLALFASCSRDVFDEYYGRPDYLEDPIYQRLEELGNFKNFTVLIEKAGYKDILSKSGYWTLFAPNDEAFTKYFQENGISDVSKIDDATASKIVKYALVFNAFRTDQLSDYQSGTGWIIDQAFRRRTAYYDGFKYDVGFDGVRRLIVDVNRNGGLLNATVNGVPVIDNNNKYITYFDKEYFAAKKLNASDYNFFYPNATFTDFNVLGGFIKEANIIAENGVIQEVTEVSLPLNSIDVHLKSDPNYSIFYDILQNNFVTYPFSSLMTNNYRNFSGNSEDVFVKTYNPNLVFSPNNENYLKAVDNDGQNDAYTLLAPNNDAMQVFITDVLTKHFKYEELPQYVFQDLVNAHMVAGAVWPSLKGQYQNGLKEELRFDFATDVEDKKVLSNGFFIGTNKVQKSNIFFSVYTSAYLNPNYSLAVRLFNDGSGYREIVSNIDSKFTLFLPSDSVLQALGYSYNTIQLRWEYLSPNGAISETGTAARNRLLRLFYNCIVPTPDGELDNIATTSGVIRTGDNELFGEYIQWDNNKIYAAGTIVAGNAVNILGSERQENGITYFIDKFPEFSTEFQGLAISRLATQNAQYSSFFNYLRNSNIYRASDGKIDGTDLGTSYTFIVPNNAAIAKAVTDGVLPASPTTTIAGQRDLIADFIRYHIIVARTASNDNLTNGLFETLRRDSKGEKTYVNINSEAKNLKFSDNSGTTANFILASSNNLADRSLIHLVDNYLKLTE
ncbi:fasciclin domain-containing protein [Flavobacterium sp. FZUC8N2.13]|uniref:Fasciclin domain-containing protein n=1 Tax=Flavobacterium zubiriense TaxID=3138075 RepID=A0ABV4T8Z1_9FLAO